MISISKLLDPKSIIGKTLKSGKYFNNRKQKFDLEGTGKIVGVQFHCNIFDELCLCLTLDSKQEVYFKTSESLPIW